MDTQMAYHLGIDASRLSDERWAETLAQLQDILKKEAQAVRRYR